MTVAAPLPTSLPLNSSHCIRFALLPLVHLVSADIPLNHPAVSSTSEWTLQDAQQGQGDALSQNLPLALAKGLPNKDGTCYVRSGASSTGRGGQG